MLTVTSCERDQRIGIDLVGRMDGSPCCKAFVETVKDRIHEGHRDFVVDLENVEWMTSCGIGCLVAAYTSVRRVSGTLKLHAPNSRVLAALEVTGLVPTVFEIVDGDDLQASA